MTHQPQPPPNPYAGQAPVNPQHPDLLRANQGRQKRNLMITVALMEAPAVLLLVFGYAVVGSTAMLWAGLGLMVAATVYFMLKYAAISRSGGVDRHLTPPGGSDPGL